MNRLFKLLQLIYECVICSITCARQVFAASPAVNSKRIDTSGFMAEPVSSLQHINKVFLFVSC